MGFFSFMKPRPKSALMRDRKYKSQEPHEQAYKRKTSPKNPHYKYSDGGGVERGATIEVVGKGDRGAFRKREYEGMTEKEVSDWWESRGYNKKLNWRKQKRLLRKIKQKAYHLMIPME